MTKEHSLIHRWKHGEVELKEDGNNSETAASLERLQTFCNITPRINKSVSPHKPTHNTPTPHRSQSRLPFGASKHVASSRGCFGR